ncbi:Predicted branched-chain amino acid permease (azaleucine resistance) [Palleronia salina]|uniref:Predicted branched-chain amino acid permease (Azaleucine resistance) n=1 Tax=Palleronia salina TaxID=313368 RepID=A0A1M6KAQ1_9RHOB|nr:AzlC family ABC transporter permease [Palleronia salina]SHJ56025.1 Predicted branched-chain amino acid permease (azaleucine resistance) [Palleronia salina]
MGATTAKSAFGQGVLLGLPFILVIVPFGALFGVVATEAGLNLWATMGFSALVIAGAAQFTALSLMGEDAATWLVIVTALAVNLRMAMYSAALVPHLGAAPLGQRACAAYLLVDQTFAAASATYDQRPEMDLRAKLALFFGIATPIVPLWYVSSLAGALLGASIPEAWALDFALPLTFIAMLGPMLRTLAHVGAALVSIALSLAFAGLPAGVGLLLAGGAAMVTGALIETWSERRA